MSKLLLVLLVLVVNVAHANPLEDELLEGDKAFQLSTRVIDGNSVEASWKIAKGYYLYREKFKFEPQDDGVLVKEVALPPGKRKRDEFFGDVETYRDQVKALVTLGRNDTAARTLKLKITSQGCADIGVCYPPQIKTVELKLPAVKGAAQVGAAATPQSLQNLGDLLGGQDEFLEPDKAFAVSAQAQGNNAMVQFQIAPGYYLYRDKMKVSLAADSDLKLGTVELPPGKVKVDEFFGKTEVYYDNVTLAAPLTGAAKVANLTVQYQGCAEKGICYPPQTKQLKVSLDGAGGAAAGPAPPSGGRAAAGVAGKAFWLAVFAAFGTGLLLTFTPCVLPMIPILSSIIVGQGGHLSKWRGGLLSGMYVLGTAVTYTIAGVLAGATGDQLQAYFQNVWAIGLFALLFVLLALSMFGFYELQMPSFIQSRLQSQAQNMKGGSLIGVFVMGLVSALIVGACVSPLLISGLAVAISNKDPVLGGAIMFSMALGMGVILIAIGVGASWLLPRAGAWMNTVKYVFGVLLLAVAIYLLGALPQVPVLYLWGALFIVVAVYLGATETLPPGASGWRYLWKGVGTLFLVWGVFALLGALAGNRDVMHPLSWHAPAASGTAPAAANAPVAHVQFERITTVAQLDQALAKARGENKPAIVDFYASWCTDCVRMERTTFVDPRVAQAMARFALIQVDVTDNNADARAVKQRVGVLGPPAMLFFDAQGQEHRDLRFYGYKPADEFLTHIGKL